MSLITLKKYLEYPNKKEEKDFCRFIDYLMNNITTITAISPSFISEKFNISKREAQKFLQHAVKTNFFEVEQQLICPKCAYTIDEITDPNNLPKETIVCEDCGLEFTPKKGDIFVIYKLSEEAKEVINKFFRNKGRQN